MFSRFKISGAILAMLLSSSVFADLAIIVNPAYDDGKMDTQDVKKIFLGERQAFPDGLRAYPINHNAGSADRKEFFSSVLSIDESSHVRHWRRRSVTGGGSAPVEVNSHKAVLDKVAHTSGGISYINARLVDKSVKVLMIINDNGIALN